jgi:hypothetical protein
VAYRFTPLDASSGVFFEQHLPPEHCLRFFRRLDKFNDSLNLQYFGSNRILSIPIGTPIFSDGIVNEIFE